MERPRVEVDLSAPGAAALADDLARGGLFVPGEELAIESECEVAIFGVGEPFVIVATVVFADGTGIGVQLQIDLALRDQLVEIARRAPAMDEALAPDADTSTGDEPDDDTVQDEGDDTHTADPLELDAVTDADTIDRDTLDAITADPDAAPAGANDGGERAPLNVYERLRGLTLVQQFKVARRGELHERIALERIYGKTVWEQLLRNPRITPHEVARIARMGTLPRPQLETIVGNGGWLGVPEVRRALLTNTRLTAEMIPRILRHLPKHELKLVPMQLAYTAAVREVARRMLRSGEV